MFDDNNPELNNQNTSTQPPENTQQTTTKESEREYNLRLMAERARRAEERTAELERYVESQKKQQQPTSNDDDIDLDDDSYIEGKHFKKYVRTLKDEIKQAKEQLKEFTQQTSTSSAELKLKAKYNDFDAIVTQENIQKLAAMKPAHYRSIMANPDLYDKGEAAYDLIKNFVANNEYAQQDKRIEENKSKPRSSGSTAASQSDTPLSRIGDYDRRVLSDGDRERIMRMVKEAKRNG